MYRYCGKRCLDLIIALIALLVAWPILALIAVTVRLSSQGPVLFHQQRLGRLGRVFWAYKFRSMTNRVRQSDHEITSRDPDVTRVGYWLRRLKLDELPQLINVLKGDMSIVGPRPALPQQLAQYDEMLRKRLSVRPGLTGLAQVHGNIHLSWPERWRYDLQYVERLSLWLDFWIILRTVGVVLFGEEKFVAPRPVSDASPEDKCTMSR